MGQNFDQVDQLFVIKLLYFSEELKKVGTQIDWKL